MNWEPLLEAAAVARSHSHSPYSRFAVGAAIEAESGRIFGGANVENRSYGATLCAERSAFAAAISAGERSFRAIAIVTDTSPPSPPCGICRETMTEFCRPEMPVLLANPGGERRLTTVGDLFPQPFQFPPERTSGR